MLENNALNWRKSTRCGSSACVEVARDGAEYLVRDSKNPDSAPLRFTDAEWRAFVAGVNAGEFSF
jgi:hypothetical protein